VTQESSPDFDGDADIDGFPFELYDDNKDLVSYIDKTRN